MPMMIQLAATVSANGTSNTEINEAASGSPNLARFLFMFVIILAITAYASYKWAKKISTVKEDERARILNNEVEGFPSYTSVGLTSQDPSYDFNPEARGPVLGGRTGWYPNAEGTLELYMNSGVSTGLERPHGYGEVTDGPEARPAAQAGEETPTEGPEKTEL